MTKATWASLAIVLSATLATPAFADEAMAKAKTA